MLAVSAILSALAWGIVQRRREQPGANELQVFLTGTLIWSLTYALHWSSVAPADKYFWLNMTYLGVTITPPSMALFIMQTTQPAHAPAGAKKLLFYIIPAATLVLLATDNHFGLFYGGKQIPGQSRIYDGGLGFWLNVVYSYTLTLFSLGMLWIALRQPNPLQRNQARLLLAGILFPVGISILTLGASTLLGWSPFVGLDLTPVAFTFTGVILSVGLLRERLLGLTSIGRDVLVEQMSEGMLMLDAAHRIVDLNPAARKLLDLPDGDLIGLRADDALQAHPEVSRLLFQEKALTTELALALAPTAPEDGGKRYLRVQITPLMASHGRVAGLVAICHDITQRKNFEQSLKAQIRQIEALQQDLREQATRDGLTGLFNRRYIQETLPRELARAERERSPVSMVMLDLDHFKRLNDAFGHQAGDLLLQRLAQILTENTRRGDIVARYGGEEFLVALMDSTPEAARKRVEQWRAEFGACAVPYEGNLLQTTVSAGLASFPGDGSGLDELVRKADAAMYRAKAAGRNRVVVYDGNAG